jgi:hypothetical protein
VWDRHPAESQRSATIIDRDGVAVMLQKALPHGYSLGDLRPIRGQNRIDVEAKYGLEATEEEIIDGLMRAGFTLGPDVGRSGKTPGKSYP